MMLLSHIPENSKQSKKECSAVFWKEYLFSGAQVKIALHSLEQLSNKSYWTIYKKVTARE